MNTRTLSVIATAFSLLLASVLFAARPDATTQTPAQRDARMAWWRQAKFGMFIHWGLYSIPAGQWNGQPIPGNSEWIKAKAKISDADYDKLAGQFNPVKFNADQWVQLAKDSGMTYLVFVAKHHDGFAMYDSKVDPYTIVKATPFQRDPARELSDACARHDITFCVYYSHNLDWHEPYATASRDKGPGSDHDFSQYMHRKALPQVKELLTGYGPLGLVWFDMSGGMTREQSQAFADLVHAIQPQCLINSRVSKTGVACDYLTKGDHSIPNSVGTEDWETPDTVNDHWGFCKDDQNWKTPSQMIFNLVDVVSKGGNYLFNVGPTAEGLIPQPCQDNLRAAGAWLKTNGQAIYGAGPTPFGAELGAPSFTEKDPKTGKPTFVIRRAFRCTTQPGKLYLHLFEWPGTHFEWTGVKGNVAKAYLLADASHTPLKFTQAEGKVSILLPDKAPDAIATVLCLEMINP